jgi:hypothetical protein
MIAAMFKALNPPQYHGHSGIMTSNFFEITHCTASPERITANLDQVTVDGVVTIPTSLRPDFLQYAWPGSLTQSVEDAVNSIELKDPGGTSYSFSSFNPGSEGEGTEIIPPLVIKPLPENEATVRPTLRKVADTARSKGAIYDSNGDLKRKGGCYYCFYCYTKPEISLGFTDGAAANAGWAQGMSPAVCSSFVWLCMKENNIPLVSRNQFEQLDDFSPSAVHGGAQVGTATRDGLIFYPQADRLQGAQALKQMILNQALDQEKGLGTIPGVNESIAGPIADQLINMFAFGNPNMVGSSAWQTPGDGNAVSPDNIRWWNPPYYGYAEPLQYLPEHTENYTVSRWKKVTTRNTIKGTVKMDGRPVPHAHVWVYLPGGETYTDQQGNYVLQNIPIGNYVLQGQATITTNGVAEEETDTVNIKLAAGAPLIENIELHGLPVNYRRLDFKYSISCDHGDGNPFNKHGVESAGPYSHSLFVNPGHVKDSFTYTFDYNGGGYFHIDYVFTVELLQNGSVKFLVEGTMYDDGSGSQQAQHSNNPIDISRGQVCTGYIDLENDGGGYHNGNSHFSFTMRNNQQTG